MIELQHVTKRFGDLVAVNEVSFTARKGGVFGLLGPNGAGKSTTIRMIMNIIAPDQGTILFDGKPIAESDKERIGYLPEERGLYKKVTVNDMLTYLGELKGRTRTEIQPRIDYWLDRFELTGWKHKKIDELSKGMSQKVQFIGSIVHDPHLLFFDEPFSGLDPVSADLLRDTILELGRSGKTILFSTHILDHAERICNDIFIINKGREVISGTMEEIKDRHGTRTVIVEFDGDDAVVDGLPMVKSTIRYPRWIEAELADGADADEMLAALVGKVSIRRFELVSPSLHKIFVDLVGKPVEEVA
jgi:ABC-2 type transport system ATP-binding protein